MNREEILYEKTGLIYTEHPKIIEAMNEYAEKHSTEQLNLHRVSHRRELLIDFMEFMYKDHFSRVKPKILKKIDKFLKSINCA